ncbi:hypothetical protein [Aureivirga sp. CE67]|uniref:hypothetical protein n=1 Tax=Aureivirga sp. CE67 TaxID=1788983 RepID=UPI0018CA264E|nr:hypothetical protein [Aureivirga sp. CE67]
MKITLTILGLLFSIFSFGQANDETIQVIAKLVSPGKGSKIYIAKYEIIKAIKGNVTNDTIQVGYYFYNEYKNAPDTVLLNLKKYTGETKTKDYYIFPDYDAKKGIEEVKLSYIDFDYWEACEIGEKKCEPLTLKRPKNNEKWFLIMPCGGTSTTVTLSEKQVIPEEKDIIQKSEISTSQCPPIFDLTKLKDGKYFAYMISCGLGGQIEINLITDK